MARAVLGDAFNAVNYNALASILDADAAVGEGELRQEFLLGAARLLLAYGLEKRFGVGLLHKHNDCDDDEHMIQFQERLDGEDVLVTRATRAHPRDLAAAPTVWTIIGDDYVPLEFTTDGRSRDLLADRTVPTEFLRDFAALKRSSPIGAYFGLAVVQRDFYDLVGEADVAIELSYFEDKSNIVFVRRRDEVNQRIIQTGWSFEGLSEATLGCTATIECEKYCRQTCGADTDGSHKKHYERHRPVTLAHT